MWSSPPSSPPSESGEDDDALFDQQQQAAAAFQQQVEPPDYTKFARAALSEQQATAVGVVVDDGANVALKAVAGAGKTRTALTASAELLEREAQAAAAAAATTGTPAPEACVIFISYNARLREETWKQLYNVPPHLQSRILVHTYHSLAATLYGVAGNGDGLGDNGEPAFEETIQRAGSGTARFNAGKLRKQRVALLVLDEAQDMTPPFFRLVKTLLRDLCDHAQKQQAAGQDKDGAARMETKDATAAKKRAASWPLPQLLLVGDPCQLVYGYRDASVDYMHHAAQLFELDSSSRCDRTNPVRVLGGTGTGSNSVVPLLLNESFRVSPQIAAWVNKNLDPNLLQAHWPHWFSTTGRDKWAKYWGEGIVGRAAVSPEVQEHVFVRGALAPKPSERSENQLFERYKRYETAHRDSTDVVVEPARMWMKRRTDALNKIDHRFVDNVIGLIDHYGEENVAIIAPTVGLRNPTVQQLMDALPFACRHVIHGKAISNPGAKLVVTSITSFKGVERDAIVMLGFDGALEDLYREEPGALLNQFYVGATRARRELLIGRPSATPAFATQRDPKRFFTVESLSDEQWDVAHLIVEHDHNVLVNAVAGSGKTRTAVATAGYLIQKLSRDVVGGRGCYEEVLDSDCDDAGGDAAASPLLSPTPPNVETLIARCVSGTDAATKAEQAGGGYTSRNCHRVVLMTFNKSLQIDMQNQAYASLPAERRSLVKVSTIHALANAYFRIPQSARGEGGQRRTKKQADGGWFVDDAVLMSVVDQRMPLIVSPPPPVELVIVDEAQDLSDTQARFIQYFLSCLPKAPRMYLCGDYFQLIYAFNGAEGRYLLQPEYHFTGDLLDQPRGSRPDLNQQPTRPLYRWDPKRDKGNCLNSWRHVRLSVSFRITHGMAEFINEQLNPTNLRHDKRWKQWWQQNGKMVEAMWCEGIRADPNRPKDPDNDHSVMFLRNYKNIPGSKYINQVETTADKISAMVATASEGQVFTFSEDNSVVMASSISNEKSPARLIAGHPKLRHFNFAFIDSKGRDGDMFDAADLGERIEELHKLQVTTIHQMKGRERDFTAFIGLDGFCVKSASFEPHQILETFNRMYVACTRARKKLLIVEIDGDKYPTVDWCIQQKPSVQGPDGGDGKKCEWVALTDITRNIGRNVLELVSHESDDGALSFKLLAQTGRAEILVASDLFVPGRQSTRGQQTAEQISAFLGCALEERIELALNKHGFQLLPSLETLTGGDYHNVPEDFTDEYARMQMEQRQGYEEMKEHADDDDSEAVSNTQQSAVGALMLTEWAKFMQIALLRVTAERRQYHSWRQQRHNDFSRLPCTPKLNHAFINTVRLLFAACTAETPTEFIASLKRTQNDQGVEYAIRVLRALRAVGRLASQQSLYLPVKDEAFRKRAGGPGIQGIADYMLLPVSNPGVDLSRAKDVPDGFDVACKPNSTVIVELKFTRREEATHRLQVAGYAALMRRGFMADEGIHVDPREYEFDTVSQTTRLEELAAGDPRMFVLYAAQGRLVEVHNRDEWNDERLVTELVKHKIGESGNRGSTNVDGGSRMQRHQSDRRW